MEKWVLFYVRSKKKKNNCETCIITKKNNEAEWKADK